MPIQNRAGRSKIRYWQDREYAYRSLHNNFGRTGSSLIDPYWVSTGFRYFENEFSKYNGEPFRFLAGSGYTYRSRIFFC